MMRGMDLVAAAVSLTMYFIKGKAKNKKGSKRCLDYLAEEAKAISCELKGIKPSSWLPFQQP